MKGLYPDDEVWLMSEAEKRDAAAELATIKDNSRNITTIRNEWKDMLKPIESVLCTLTEDELNLFYDILMLLDKEYTEEIPPVERLFVSLEYIKYMRWLQYTLTTPPELMRHAQVTYEKVIGDKMMEIFSRLNGIRREKEDKKDKLVDFVVETLPESEVVVKKVRYGEKNTQDTAGTTN